MTECTFWWVDSEGVPVVDEVQGERRVTFREGMRVVVKDGPWPVPRVGGHFGKVVQVGHEICDAYVRVQITGHVDGAPPDLLPEWFYDVELEVVD